MFIISLASVYSYGPTLCDESRRARLEASSQRLELRSYGDNGTGIVFDQNVHADVLPTLL